MIPIILMGDYFYPKDPGELKPLRFRAGAFSISPSTYHSSMENYMKGRNAYVIKTIDTFNGELPISYCPILVCPGNPLNN